METEKRTTKDKWEIVMAVSVISLFMASLLMIVGALILTSSDKNYELTKQVEFSLKKLTVDSSTKGKDIYSYQTVLGAKKVTERVEVKTFGKAEVKIQMVVIADDQEEKIVLKEHRLKNDFFNSKVKKYNPIQEYTFFVHEKNWVDTGTK